MRHNARTLAGLAVLLFVVGLVLAFENRDDIDATNARLGALAAVIGLVVTGASLLTMVSVETTLDGLTVPEPFKAQVLAAQGLPTPSWWGPLALGSAATLGTGLFVDRYLVGLGTGLLAVAVGAGVMEVVRKRTVKRERSWDSPAVLDRRTVAHARRLQNFAAEHDGVTAVMSGLGFYGAKLTLVGGNGRTGEVVVADLATAELVCELTGTTVTTEWPRELSAQVAHTPVDWKHMGRRRAHTREWQEPAVEAEVTPEKVEAETPGPTAAEAGAAQTYR